MSYIKNIFLILLISTSSFSLAMDLSKLLVEQSYPDFKQMEFPKNMDENDPNTCSYSVKISIVEQLLINFTNNAKHINANEVQEIQKKIEFLFWQELELQALLSTYTKITKTHPYQCGTFCRQIIQKEKFILQQQSELQYLLSYHINPQ